MDVHYISQISLVVQNVYTSGSSDDTHLMAFLQPIRDLQQEQKKLITMVVESQKKVLTAVEELKTMISEQTKKNFQIKGTASEVSIMQSFLCNSYSRVAGTMYIFAAWKLPCSKYLKHELNSYH